MNYRINFKFIIIVIILFVLIAIFARQIAPFPLEGAGKTNVPNSLCPPSWEHPFGAEKLGRDVLSRVIVGAQPALIIPIGVVLFAILIGAPLGALAGYKGGWVDELIMRITDLFLAFPSLLLAMAKVLFVLLHHPPEKVILNVHFAKLEKSHNR